MKRFLAGIMTAAMVVTTVASFAFASNAAPEGETNIKGIIPRTDVDATIDAKDDEEFWAKAYTEELNEATAFIKETQLADDPTTDLPSLTIKMAYYSEIPEGTDPALMRYSRDMNGGILIYAEVIDKHKAFAFGETVIDSFGNSSFNGSPSANATDCVQFMFDPLNMDGAKGGDNGSVIFSFVPYSIVAPEGSRGSSPGVGTIAGGRGWWWQHWGESYGDISSSLLRNAVEMKSNTDYVFDPNYPLPDDSYTGPAVLKRMAIQRAYQYASIEGYQIEAKIHWNLFEIDNELGIKPYEGRQFGLMISLVDYMFDDFNISCSETDQVVAAQHVYRVYLNGGDEDEGWLSVDNPRSYPTYQFGGFIGDEPEIIYGDVTGDGIVDIEDAMAIFYHVAKKELLTEEYQLKCADTNDDGNIDIADAMNVFYYVARKTDSVRP